MNKFVYGINFNIIEMVRILMPHTLHETIQKSIIDEEELVGSGPSRPPGSVVKR